MKKSCTGKKLLALLLALIMVLGMLPMTVFAADEQTPPEDPIPQEKASPAPLAENDGQGEPETTPNNGESELVEIKAEFVYSSDYNWRWFSGQKFMSEIVVTARYSDDSSKEVTGYTIADGDNLTADQDSVTINYTEGDVTKTCLLSISPVLRPTVESLWFLDEINAPKAGARQIRYFFTTSLESGTTGAYPYEATRSCVWYASATAPASVAAALGGTLLPMIDRFEGGVYYTLVSNQTIEDDAVTIADGLTAPDGIMLAVNGRTIQAAKTFLCPDDEPITPKLISVSYFPPAKIEYSPGEDFDPAGMQVWATYDDGSFIPISDYSISGEKNLSPHAEYVTISYTDPDCGVTETCQVFIEMNTSTDDEILPSPAPEYKMLEGAEQIIPKNAETATFRSEAPYSKFERVELDGENLDPSHYDVREGSTVITLKKAFLDSLAPGEHIIAIVSGDGAASSSFVKSAYAEPSYEFSLVVEEADADRGNFKAGDKIIFNYHVKNNSEYNILPDHFTNSSTGTTWSNESGFWVGPDNERPFGRFTHTVTEQEVKSGVVVIEAEMFYSFFVDDTKVTGPKRTILHEYYLGAAMGSKGVTVFKYETSTPAKDARYLEGEKVTFNTVITNNTDDTLTNVTLKEETHRGTQLTALGNLAPHDSIIVSSYDVPNHSDYLRGFLYSFSTATWDCAWELNKEYDASVSSNTVGVPVGDANADYKPNKESFVSIKISAKTPPANGVAYQLDEEIELKFEIVNRSFQNNAKDLATNTTGVNWSVGNDKKELLQTQALWSDTYATHTVDWHDILIGEVKVQAYVDARDAETDEYCGSFSNVLVLPVSGSTSEWPNWKDQSIGLTQELANAPANGKYFVAGETVEITVTTHEQINGEFETFTNYNYSRLHTGKGAEAELVYLEELALKLGDSIRERSQTFSYTVTPEDVEQGWIRSEIDGWAEYDVVSRAYFIDGRPEYDTEYDKFYYTGDPLVVPCGWPNPTQVTLSANAPANGSFYIVGEKVPLSVRVYFESAAQGIIPPLKYAQEQLLQLTDDWENVDFSRDNELEKYTGIYQGTIYYTVTQEDADRGSAELAYAFGAANKEGEQVYKVTSDSVALPCRVPVEENTGLLGITQIETSVPANGVYYTEGETITYQIEITNHSEEDFGECIVTDSNLTGTLGSVEQLKAGESKSFPFSLLVTADLPILGIVFNTATVTTVYNEEQLESEATVMSRAAEEILMQGIEKRVTSNPANGVYYTQGETITFELELLESDLNGEVFEAYVEQGFQFRFNDPLTGDVLSIDLTDTDTYTQSIDYLVTAADVEAGSVTNIATLQWRTNTYRNWGSSMNSNAVTVPTRKVTPELAEYAIEVTKIVEGENAPTDTRFSFQYKDGDMTYVKFITGAGTDSFLPIHFSEAGTYTYTVTEVNSGIEGWTYDSSEIQVSIEIIEGETGTGKPALKLGTVSFTKDGAPVNGVSFTNSYNGTGVTPGDSEDNPFTPVSISIPIIKEVTKGGNVKPEERTFSFELYNFGADTTGIEVTGTTIATNGAGTYKGTIEITADTQDELDNLTEGFSLREVKGDAANWSYSTAVYHISRGDTGWNITDSNGKAIETPSFTNKYTKYVNDPKTPSTGDNSHLGLWLCLGAAGMIGIASILVLPKLKKKGQHSK